jgi:hypothetical protein
MKLAKSSAVYICVCSCLNFSTVTIVWDWADMENEVDSKVPITQYVGAFE